VPDDVLGRPLTMRPDDPRVAPRKGAAAGSLAVPAERRTQPSGLSVTPSTPSTPGTGWPQGATPAPAAAADSGAVSTSRLGWVVVDPAPGPDPAAAGDADPEPVPAADAGGTDAGGTDVGPGGSTDGDADHGPTAVPFPTPVPFATLLSPPVTATATAATASAEPSPTGPAPAAVAAAEGTADEHPADDGTPLGVIDAWWGTLAAAPLPDTLLGDGDLAAEGLDLTHAHPSGLATLLAGRPTRLSSLFREPAAHSASRRRAREIRRTVGRLAEERGVRAGYLALGLVSWWSVDVPGPRRDGRAGTPVRAPLMLRGCDLLPRGAGHDDYELRLDPAVSVNPEVLRRLREDHRLRLDSAALGGLAFGPDGFDPAPVYAHLEDVCHGVPGFAVDPRLVVGSFTAGSGALLGDLDAAAPALRAHPVVGPLVAEPPPRATGVRSPLPAGEPPEVGEAGDAADHGRPFVGTDETPTPELCVLPLDPAQRRAVRAVCDGGSVVIEGPPGSGGTQTLAAAVVALVAAGRRVLVVTPHAASARALADRISAAGLPDVVLDLHDGSGDQTAILSALATDLAAAMSGEAADRAARVAQTAGDGDVAAMTAATAVLAGASAALHAVRGPWGVSAYDAMEALAALMATDVAPRTRVRLSAEVCRRLDGEVRERLRVDLRRAAEIGAFTLTRADTRWLDAAVHSDDDVVEALAAAVTARDGLPRAQRLMDAVAEAAGIGPAGSVDGWRPQLELLCGIRDTLDTMLPAVYEQPIGDLIAATAADGAPGMGRLARRSLRHRARGLVRPGVHVRDVHRLLVAARYQRARWQELSSGGGWPRVPNGLGEAGAAVESVLAALDTLTRYLEGTDTPAMTALPLVDLAHRLGDLADDRDGLAAQPERTVLLHRLRDAGLGDLVDDLRERRCLAEDVDGELDLAWWTSVLEAVIRSDVRLARHDPAQLAGALDELRSAGDRLALAGLARIRETVSAHARDVVAAQPEPVAWLQGEVHRGHRSAWPADLFRRAGDVVGALRPVLVMSPDAVARCLPAAVAGRPLLDAVVIDDAGQVGMPEAAAAIARGRRVIVAGDPAGLPPASGRPSVLEALTPFVARHRLDRDHRARDGRLLTAMRREYPGGWAALPGAAASPPLLLDHVWESAEARAQASATGTAAGADAEVRRVVDLVTEHAGRRPGESLMVVTLSARHAELIKDALRAEVTLRPELARWLEVHWTGRISESFLVRPVHRLCGLERDAVIFSVGLGRTAHGRVLHRFGVLDGSFGRACLTAAMTRARRRVTVVSSFTAGDLDPDKLRTPGSRLLWQLLALAEDPALRGDHDPLPPADPVALPDPLVADLHDRLLAVGLPVRAGIDVPDWPVSLVLADPSAPGQLLLAVDVDGEDHAACPSVFVRDVLRREAFERAGWGYVRVAAMDLFCDPATEVERIRRAWRAAGGGNGAGATASGLLIVGRPRVRATWPGVPIGRPIGEYTPDQLRQVAAWVLTDGVGRAVEELVAAVGEALQLVLRGPRVEALVTDAARAVLGVGTLVE